MNGPHECLVPDTAQVQADAIAFLGSGEAFDARDAVERHETHGALVFLSGEAAIKIKRAVRFAYLDFSSLEKRRAALDREFQINRVFAPELYVGVVPVTRGPGGRLKLGGDGEVVEWALRMHRFPQSSLLSRQLANGLDAAGLKALADEIFRSHRDAPVARGGKAAAALRAIVVAIATALGAEGTLAAEADLFRKRALEFLCAATPVIEKRAAAGKVRRCHGDLHLDNIAIINGRPRLFDAIEFDEALATVDTLYDLAFLLMDLDGHGYRGQANAVLNRYLWRSQDTLDLEGLAALPLFLALRAGVRAMATGQSAKLASGSTAEHARNAAAQYLVQAQGYLRLRPAALLAVGGFSGTGKSTLAAGISPLLGASPGAVHLRSDLERKALHGVDETARLPVEAYSAQESERVYAVLAEKAILTLRAQHAVVVDAVFSSPAERDAFERRANECGVPFAGIWLVAGEANLVERVEARKQDASDATAWVVQQQVARGAGTIGWHIIDAVGTVEDVRERATAVLRSALPNTLI